MGGAGPTGLDYAGVEVVMRRCGVPRDRRDDVFDDLQVLEAAALAQMRDDRAAELAKAKGR
jgi:hypothetical protein